MKSVLWWQQGENGDHINLDTCPILRPGGTDTTAIHLHDNTALVQCSCWCSCQHSTSSVLLPSQHFSSVNVLTQHLFRKPKWIKKKLFVRIGGLQRYSDIVLKLLYKQFRIQCFVFTVGQCPPLIRVSMPTYDTCINAHL